MPDTQAREMLPVEQARVETGWPGGAPDEETFKLMNELDDLQTWATLLMIRQVPKAREAADLVQRTRCFIVSRLYPNAQP